ncbi:S41 family peptidase [Mycolicibacterium brisbanense]
MEKFLMKLASIALSLPIVTVVAIVFILHSAGAGAESAPVKSPAERQIWQSDGYGYIFDISGDSVDMYNSTRDSLVPFGKGHIESDGSLYLDKILAAGERDQQFLLGRFVDGAMTDELGYTRSHRRLDRLPVTKYSGFSDDPVQNFEVFWQTYEENFSFFPVINLDWHDVYREFRPKVHPATTDEELQGIFRAMIRRLNDGHSNLFSGDDVFSSHSEGPREAFFQRSRNVIEGNVHDRYIEGGLTTKLDGRVQYGWTRSGEGYIKLLEFDVSDPDDVDQALGDMVRDLERCRTFIVDMRFNRGGEDFFGTKVAGLFTDERKVAYRKQVRTGGYDEFSEPVSIYIEPAAKRFAADRVVILTSPLTVSAGETATLALKELDNAVTVGEQTAGFFSDMLLKSLPNRQLFSLSNERYTSVGGVNFEQLGLPPDEQITTTQADVAALRDPVMDRALELSKQAP